MTTTIAEPAMPQDLPELIEAPDSDDEDHCAQASDDSDNEEPPPLEDAKQPNSTKDADPDTKDAPRLLGGPIPTFRGEKAYNTDASVLPFLHRFFPITPTSSYDVVCQYPVTFQIHKPLHSDAHTKQCSVPLDAGVEMGYLRLPMGGETSEIGWAQFQAKPRAKL